MVGHFKHENNYPDPAKGGNLVITAPVLTSEKSFSEVRESISCSGYFLPIIQTESLLPQ
jgi:hypothetical protein